MLFITGRLLATPGALQALMEAQTSPIDYLERHCTGDWGEVCAEDARLNDEAVMDGSRLLSAYPLPSGERLWIITEADRSATTLLLPQEY